MIYYMIRHKATQEFMPELKRTRGYSHWNPGKIDTLENLGKKLLGVPRLLPSRRKAHNCIVQWNAVPNGRQTFDYDGEVDLDIKDDGRSKDDLEIVEVNIEVVEASIRPSPPQRLIEIQSRLEAWRENVAEEGGDADLVAIFETHAADDIAWLLKAISGEARPSPKLINDTGHD